MKNYHSIVIGLGAVGSATLYQLSQQAGLKNQKILGIDQYTPPHLMGSSHGESRITRLACGEYPSYTLTALRSNEIWRELEEKTRGKFGPLYQATGGLIIGSVEKDPSLHGMESSFFSQTCLAAQQYNISHEMLATEEIKRRYPQFIINEGEIAYYEDEMGYLRPEACISSQLMLAEQNGAEISYQEKLLKLTVSPHQLPQLVTDKNSYTAQRIILCIGPWLTTLLPDYYPDFFKIYRQFLCWFKIDKAQTAYYQSRQCPVFVKILANGSVVYGFPSLDASSVKFGFDDDSIYQQTTSPAQVNREISQEEITNFYKNYIYENFKGITAECIKSTTCLYTSTADRRFVIDYLPDSGQQIILASACSGHGFKHSAAIGEALAQQIAYDKSSIDIFKFKNQ